MKIYFVGMPGSGKTTLGKQVARALDLTFYDLDSEIESRENKSIPEIFSESGEEYFRIKESEALRDFAARNDSFLLATGGGAPCFFGNMDLLNQTGLTVYLDVSIGTLIHRVTKTAGRPLLSGATDQETRLRNLFQQRDPVYRLANLIVSNPDSSSVLNAILRSNANN